MDLVLAEVRVDREDRAVPVLEDAGDDERRDRDDDSVDADLIVYYSFCKFAPSS